MSGLGLTPGAIFAGEYRIVRPLSAGGMGAVYVAIQLSTERERALKVMLGELLGNEDLRRRFAQEAKIGAQIDSEHVVEVVGAGIDGPTGRPWLAMELLQGRDLASHLMSSGPLEPPVVVEIFEQLTHAVGAAHDKQIVHRDLKPENLFLAQTRRKGDPFVLKVLDFGIAKLLGQARTSMTGAMGTPLWMAPEQTQAGARITPAADVWAMGLIAFRALSGRVFWRSAGDPNATSIMVLREIAIEPIPRASARTAELGGAALPDGFDAWFARCVEREPGARFAHAAEMFEELRRVLGDAPRTSASPPRISAGAFDLGRPSAASSTEPAPGPLFARTPPSASEPAVAPASSPTLAGEPLAPLSVEPAAPVSEPAVSTPGRELDERSIDPDLALPKDKPRLGLFAVAGGVTVVAAVSALVLIQRRDSEAAASATPPVSAEAVSGPVGFDELVADSKRLLEEGKLPKALDAAQSAKQLDSKRPDGYLLAGLVHGQRCFPSPGALALPCDACNSVACESCAREMTKASERSGPISARYHRGRCLAALGRNVDALGELDATIAATPKNADARLDRAALLVAMGRTHDGCNDLGVALELGATDVPATLKSRCAGAPPTSSAGQATQP